MTAAQQSSGLEQTYRDVLRWYPKRWRRRNEDAVLGTLLDVADEQNRTAPAKGELADLRSNGFAARLGPLGRIPVAVRDRVVAILFGLASGISIVALIAMAVQRETTPAVLLPYYTLVGPFVGYSFLAYSVGVLALVAALLGRKWVARALLVAAVLVAIVVHVASLTRGIDHATTTTTIVLLGVIALLSFVGNPFGTRRGRLWLAVSSGGWAAFIGITLWYQRVTEGGVSGRTDWFVGPLSQWMGWLFPLVIILALVLWRATRTPWAPAILLAEIPIILFAFLGWQHLDALLSVAAYTVAIAATLAGCWAILRGFGLRFRITRA